jgi:hypothetical protein
MGSLRVRQSGATALTWWQARYIEADQEKRAQENPLLPWTNSLASRRWQVEHALLQLYTEPRRRRRPADGTRRRRIAAGNPAPPARVRCRRSPPGRSRRRRRAHLSDLALRRSVGNETPPLAPTRVCRGLYLSDTAAAARSAAAGAGDDAARQRWRWPPARSPRIAGSPSDPPRLLVSDPIHDHPTLAAQTLRIAEASGTNAYQLTLGSARAASRCRRSRPARKCR